MLAVNMIAELDAIISELNNSWDDPIPQIKEVCDEAVKSVEFEKFRGKMSATLLAQPNVALLAEYASRAMVLAFSFGWRARGSMEQNSALEEMFK